MVEQINQNEDIQFKLIKENSKKTINEESYSIIGTKRGKPFRNSNSEWVKVINSHFFLNLLFP